jgi:hypothetical protein
MAAESQKFRKLAKGTKIALNVVFIIPLFICFIVNMVTAYTLTWFFIVLFSLTLGYSIIVLPFMIKENRAIISMTSATVSLLLLIAACRIWGSEFSLLTGWTIALYCLAYAWGAFAIIKYTHFMRIRKAGFSLAIAGVLIGSINWFLKLILPQSNTTGNINVYAGVVLLVVGLVMAIFGK